MTEPAGMHRPRNVGWARAAALLYGDWGTSKAYVIGAAFLASAYASLPIILAVCVLTALVARRRRRLFVGATAEPAARSGGVAAPGREPDRDRVAKRVVGDDLFPRAACLSRRATVGIILVTGVLNGFGPKHSGSMAVGLAIPAVAVVVFMILLSAPHLTTEHLARLPGGFRQNWTEFVGVILALSGVEAIANLTGVMKLDRGATMEHPRVNRTARKAILLVAAEVVLGTSLLGWAMLSLSPSLHQELLARWDDMLTALAEHYGTIAVSPQFGRIFGIATALIVGLLLLSAVNTAIVALIGLLYLLARDGEMPRVLTRLNDPGVPRLPLVIGTCLPLLVVVFSPDQISLMELYAIGVVGAIAVNLGSCAINLRLNLAGYERAIMALTFLILFAAEMTVAKTKPNALFFVVCILIAGLSLRAAAHKHAGLETITVHREIAAAVVPEQSAEFRPNLTPGQSVLVAARGLTPVLLYALEEARFRQGNLYVLFVKELAVALPAPITTETTRWQDNQQAAEIMYRMLELGRQAGVPVVPLFVVSEDPAPTIVDLAATLGIDILMLGAPHRNSLVKLLKGNVVTQVANQLPANIQLVIHG